MGIGVAVSLAGCSNQDSSSSTEGNPEPENTTEAEPSGQEETVTEEQTEAGQGQQPYEQNESDAEVEFENLLTNNSSGWIEMENPEEQLPEENLDTGRFPALEIFTEGGGVHVDPYWPEEALYISWGEEAGEGQDIGLYVNKVNVYADRDQNDYAQTIVGEVSELENLIDEVVEGYNDVSEDMSEEYLQLIQS